MNQYTAVSMTINFHIQDFDPLWSPSLITLFQPLWLVTMNQAEWDLVAGAKSASPILLQLHISLWNIS